MSEKQPTSQRNEQKINELTNDINRLEIEIENLKNDKIFNNSTPDNEKDVVAFQITSKKAEIKELEIKIGYLG
jgi:hypothetical protein